VRTWLALLFIALLSACQQQPGGATTTPVASTPAGRDTAYFKPEVDALLAQIAARLATICVTRATTADGFDACIRSEFAHAFDDSGMGGKSCAFHVALGDFLDCIAIGNAFIDVRRRLSDDSPLPVGYWSGRNAMASALAASVVSRGMIACGETGELQQLTACVETWFEKQLALPVGLIDRCDLKTAAGDERQGCIAEAFMLRYLQDHAPRVGAVST
jgi:hypothetical protein